MLEIRFDFNYNLKIFRGIYLFQNFVKKSGYLFSIIIQLSADSPQKSISNTVPVIKMVDFWNCFPNSQFDLPKDFPNSPNYPCAYNIKEKELEKFLNMILEFCLTVA